ncbi:hypothetical protein LCGC14_2024780 [marine sediment metagenome]|uniref:Uncharacterized protein n=1 Tax=marine sediment metagenome TaxID=412755 RepID=A0A0F9H9T6_9ZZZZ
MVSEARKELFEKITTPEQRSETRRVEEALRLSPEQRITRPGAGRFTGGGLGGRPGPTQAQIQAAKIEAAKEKALIEKTRRKGEERLRTKEAERLRQEKVAKKEKNRLIRERRRIIDAGARVVRKQSRDARTGDVLRIIETRKGGVLIREVRNMTTGETRFERFAPGVGGGARRQTALVTVTAPLKPTALQILNSFIKNPGDFTTTEVIGGVREAGVVPVGARLGFPSVSEKLDVLPEETRKLIEKKSKKNQKKIFDTLAILGLEFTIPITEAVVGLKQLPSAIRSIAKDPKKLKKVPGNIISSFKETGLEITALAKVSPTRAVVRIGGELFVIIASGKVLKVTGKVTGKAVNRINPFLKKVKGGRIIIKTTRGKTTLRVGGTVKRIAEPLSKQARLAGKKVTAVSAQADRLVNLIKTKRIIRKPIPGEKFLSFKTKKLLSRFERRIISKRQLINLDNRIRIEIRWELLRLF